MKIKSFFSLFLLVLASGCFGPSKLSVSAMTVTPPSLMVAKRSNRTVYLVVDSSKVPPEVPVLVGGEDRGGRLTDVHEFIKRDLKKAFLTYFENVQVITPGQPTDSQPHVVVDVKLDRVEILLGGQRSNGAVTVRSGVAALTWGLGLRMSEDNEYLYSFAGQSVGAPTEDPSFAFRSMFESGITDMLKGYTDKKIHEKVLEAPAPSSPAITTSGL